MTLITRHRANWIIVEGEAHIRDYKGNTLANYFEGPGHFQEDINLPTFPTWNVKIAFNCMVCLSQAHSYNESTNVLCTGYIHRSDVLVVREEAGHYLISSLVYVHLHEYRRPRRRDRWEAF